MNHTPTPWKYEEVWEGGRVEITTQSGRGIAEIHLMPEDFPDPERDALTFADAAFICKAVNNHDALVRVLSEMVGAAEVDCMDDKSNVWRSLMLDANKLLDQLRES